MTEYTPGQWTSKVANDGDSIVVSAPSRKDYVPVCELKCGYDGPVEDEQRANAVLICAAPNMLAELKRLFDLHGYQSTADVIATAEGRAISHR